MGTRHPARGSPPVRRQIDLTRVRPGLSASAPTGSSLDALRRRNAELEAEVAALRRRYEQAEDTSRQSEKMAAIGQLTSGVTHDINNLLTGIGGGLDLARTRLAQGRVADAGHLLGLTQASVARACALARRLLAFARQQPPDPEPVEVARLVAAMVELIQSAVGVQVRVATALAAGLWPTLCDANQLETVLLNLCINARDAMAGGGRLTIEVRNATIGEAGAAARRGGAAPGDYVALRVADTGAGMPPDVVARACDPFFTTKPAGQGTGLGLSQARAFAEQAGGAVLIDSRLGWGTTVTVLLPRHAKDEADRGGMA